MPHDDATTPPPKRPGRPRVAEPLVQVQFRATATEIAQIDARAKRDERSRSAWILRVLRAALALGISEGHLRPLLRQHPDLAADLQRQRDARRTQPRGRRRGRAGRCVCRDLTPTVQRDGRRVCGECGREAR